MTKKEKNTTKRKTPRALLWQRFKSNRFAWWSLCILYVLVFVAIFGNFLANEKPLVCKLDGQVQFPILHQLGIDVGLLDKTAAFVQRDWKTAGYEWSVFPPIPHSPTSIDMRNGTKSPFSKQKGTTWRNRHWLGTDRLGHDLVAGLISGTRVAMLVGLISMSIAALIGILLGAVAGYFGDNGFRITLSGMVLNLLGIFIGWFYAFQARTFEIKEGGGFEMIKSLFFFLSILLLCNGLNYFLKKWTLLNKKVDFPLDLLVLRTIEVFDSIPGMLLLLALIAVLPNSSILYVMVIIGLIRWPSIARYLRAELLRIRNMGYIESGRALGFSDWRILFRHALPNALTPVLIIIAFGMASAVLLESALSFLGLGIGEDEITWGRLLSEARNYKAAWWLAVFPGIAIFLTVTVSNLIGEGLTEAMGSSD